MGSSALKVKLSPAQSSPAGARWSWTTAADAPQVGVGGVQAPRTIPEEAYPCFAIVRNEAPPELPVRRPHAVLRALEGRLPGCGHKPPQPEAWPALCLSLRGGPEVVGLRDGIPELQVRRALPHLVQHGVVGQPAARAEGRVDVQAHCASARAGPDCCCESSREAARGQGVPSLVTTESRCRKPRPDSLL